MMPRFVSDGWLKENADTWELKEGAPDNIKQEFDEFMRESQKALSEGKIIDY